MKFEPLMPRGTCRTRILSSLLALSATATFAGPCDIYEAGGTPCVGAHSTVRALYTAYSGNLYQVRRASDKTTKDIPVLTTGGYANTAVQDLFCANTTCLISELYDQSPKGNHLLVTPPGYWEKDGGREADASEAKIQVDGHFVHGIHTAGSGFTSNPGVGYRNNHTTGVATGDQPEGIYMVADGKHYDSWCCFDYGNAEVNDTDDGPGTMEAIYFGNSTQWGKGSGIGPWVMGDLEDGLFAGQSFSPPASNTTVSFTYLTAMLKGNSGNSWALKAGDAQTGNLKTMYSGARPAGQYNPMRKQGAIVLGTGGDNSANGEGIFFEGAVTKGFPTDAVEDLVQANIVQAGYGRTTTSVSDRGALRSPISTRFDAGNGTAIVGYDTDVLGAVRIRVVDLQGRVVATLVNGVVPAGRHEVNWNTKQMHPGIYSVAMVIDGTKAWSQNILVGH